MKEISINNLKEGMIVRIVNIKNNDDFIAIIKKEVHDYSTNIKRYRILIINSNNDKAHTTDKQVLTLINDKVYILTDLEVTAYAI